LGDWAYYSVNDDIHALDEEQKFGEPLLTVIYKSESKTQIKGWRGSQFKTPHFVSSKVAIFDDLADKGQLLYDYTLADKENINGMVQLHWYRHDLSEPIREMSGWFNRMPDGEKGFIIFKRLNPKEKLWLVKSEYI